MSANPATLWSADEIADLTRLHAQREPSLSFTQIAVKLGRKRSACIGKAHRLKLPDRSEMRRHGRPVKSRAAIAGWKGRRRGPVSPTRLVAAARQKAMAARPEPSPVRVVLADAQDGCRWPCGDHPFVFCAGPVEKGQVYCEPHCRIAYRPKRVERAA